MTHGLSLFPRTGSYPVPGSWHGINAAGTVEDVNGLGLVVDFDSYANVEVLPSVTPVANVLPGTGDPFPWME